MFILVTISMETINFFSERKIDMKHVYCPECMVKGELVEMVWDWLDEYYECDECGTKYDRNLSKIPDSSVRGKG